MAQKIVQDACFQENSLCARSIDVAHCLVMGSLAYALYGHVRPGILHGMGNVAVSLSCDFQCRAFIAVSKPEDRQRQPVGSLPIGTCLHESACDTSGNYQLMHHKLTYLS